MDAKILGQCKQSYLFITIEATWNFNNILLLKKIYYYCVTIGQLCIISYGTNL